MNPKMAPHTLGRRLCALLIVLSAGNLFGQRYSFRNYSQEQGLANLTIYCLLQDRAGYLWAGTANGLFRYDGTRFERFGPARGLPSAAISNLVQTRDGTLWAATGDGLWRQAGDSRFVPVNLGRRVMILGQSDLAADPSVDRVYLSTTDAIFVIDRQGDKQKVATLPYPAANEIARAIHLDRTGALWVAAGNRIHRWQHKQWTAYGPESGVIPGQYGAMITDSAGDFWVRSARRLIVLRKGAIRFTSDDDGLPPAAGLATLSLDAKGRIFVATGLGIARRCTPGPCPAGHGNWELISHAGGLSADSTSCMMQDREGSVWIGLYAAGLDRWQGYEEWEQWTANEGLSSDFVWSIAQDRAGAMLIGTDKGLNRIVSQGRGRAWTESQGLAGDRVRAITLDATGNIWTASSPGGISRIDQKTGHITTFRLTEDKIYSLAFDATETLWAGTLNGLFRGRRSGSGWRFERDPISQPDEIFFQVLNGRAGRLWAAGSRGLLLRDGDNWTRLTNEEVSHIAEARDGSIWMGNREKGRVSFARLREGVWTIHQAPASVTADVCYSLGFDAADNLWVGTDNGVRVLDHGAWRRYRRPDGLSWDDTNSGAFFRDSAGSIWIGTGRGLSRRLAGAPIRKPLVPKTVISDMATGSGQDRTLSFHFTALSFVNEPKVRFRYRLIGLEKDWVETTQRQVRYPALPPGDYNFSVAARNAGGEWSEPASAAFHVAPPWWRSWWFIVIAWALVLSFGRFLWFHRVRSLMVQQRRLESAVEQRTKDLEAEKCAESARNRVFEMIASNQPLAPILNGICEMVENQHSDISCCIWARSGGTVDLLAAPRVPSDLWPLLSTLGEHSAIRDLACFLVRKVTDLAPRPLAGRLQALGVRSLWSQPFISAENTYLGQITLLANKPQAPPAAGSILDTAARLAVLGIEHRELHDQLQYRANYDNLTGLANRALLKDRLVQALARATRRQTRVAVVYIDLDRFKQINDTFSHRVGDLFLQGVASRLVECLRPPDTLARMGGDEFVAVIHMDQDADAGAVAQSLLRSLELPFHLDGHDLQAGASIGVSVYPNDGQEPDLLQKYADIAMYRAKAEGRNRYRLFSPQDAASHLDSVTLERDLRKGLELGQFELHYQPKMTRAGLAGFEALLRFRHPSLGLVQPARFIPIAEESGLIVQIGEWVLGEACRQIQEWIAQGLEPAPVAVNISARQLALKNFPERIASLMARYRIDPQWIELELTETLLMHDVEQSILHMNALRDLGLRLSIDDFGTGYSSLSYLHRLPVHALKIDRSFVQSLDAENSAQPLVGAIIVAGHSLGLEVIAEGVETQFQRRMLEELGCDALQGFLFSRPKPEREIRGMLTSYRWAMPGGGGTIPKCVISGTDPFNTPLSNPSKSTTPTVVSSLIPAAAATSTPWPASGA